MRAAEIGLIASKYQPSSSGKKTSFSSRSSDASPVAIGIEQLNQQHSLEQKSSVPDENNQPVERQQSIFTRNSSAVASVKLTSEVTSTAEAASEVPGAIKTTINIGIAMNHVNDQENLKQLNLAPVQVNEVEEMDTQEGGTGYPHLFHFIEIFLVFSISFICFDFCFEGYGKLFRTLYVDMNILQ